MNKSTHFFGQPEYGQLIKISDKTQILQISRIHGGERYVKSFDGWHHLITKLYAVIMRFDSLREIEASMLAEVRKLALLGRNICQGAARWLMQIKDVRKGSLRRFIAICMIKIRINFLRTAEGTVQSHGLKDREL